MSATIIDGRKLAADTRAEIAAGVAALKAEKGVTPGLRLDLSGDAHLPAEDERLRGRPRGRKPPRQHERV